jgi:hypothetical protein
MDRSKDYVARFRAPVVNAVLAGQASEAPVNHRFIHRPIPDPATLFQAIETLLQFPDVILKAGFC